MQIDKKSLPQFQLPPEFPFFPKYLEIFPEIKVRLTKSENYSRLTRSELESRFLTQSSATFPIKGEAEGMALGFFERIHEASNADLSTESINILMGHILTSWDNKQGLFSQLLAPIVYDGQSASKMTKNRPRMISLISNAMKEGSIFSATYEIEYLEQKIAIDLFLIIQIPGNQNVHNN